MSQFQIYSGKVRVRASAIVVKEGSILLINQNVPTKKYPVWLPPGGGVHLSETTEEALVREVKEETGLSVKPNTLRYIHEFIQNPFHAIEFYYLCDVESGILKKGCDPEHNPESQIIHRVEWIPLIEMNNYELFPEFLRDEIAQNSLMNKDRISHFKST